MTHPEISFFLIKSSKLLKHCKGTFKQWFHHFHCNFKLSAVVIDLQHFFYLFDLQHIIKTKPLRFHHFIRCFLMINDLVFCRMLIHVRALQHFQKSKLQLIRLQCINFIKRFCKSCVVLIRKPCDQIEMFVDIFTALDFSNNIL